MSEHVIHVSQANFQQEVLESPVPVIVDFWAPWCGPCKAIGPVLEELAEAYGGTVRVAKVNVDEEPALAGAFQVQGIPTLVGIRNQTVAAHAVGFRGRPALEQMFVDLTTGAQA